MVDAALLYCFTANYSSCILSTHVPSSYRIHRKLISQHTKLTHKPNIEGKKNNGKTFTGYHQVLPPSRTNCQKGDGHKHHAAKHKKLKTLTTSCNIQDMPIGHTITNKLTKETMS
jgi:hypothetical protein